jgi:hypothetical protein
MRSAANVGGLGAMRRKTARGRETTNGFRRRVWGLNEPLWLVFTNRVCYDEGLSVASDYSLMHWPVASDRAKQVTSPATIRPS